jgi:N-acetylneuraminic acid mutarotase/glucose/arabinose dehydrogenase
MKMLTLIRRLSFIIIVCSFFGACSQKKEFNFGTSLLKSAQIQTPTSLQFGPDGRLYVSQQNGIIKIFGIKKTAANDYTVVSSEIIDIINRMPNHDDKGILDTATKNRQVTGLLVKGTSSNPIIYVTSSDSRIGGPVLGDLNLDTNSGIVSQLSWDGTSWIKVDLVRGLPRSEEDHSPNGMQLDEKTNTLYVAVGSNTNAGAPSKYLGYTCEYALSGTILSIDLNSIDSMPLSGNGDSAFKYDLPTLDDPERPNTSNGKDINDPFGGNDGLNQAKITLGGPVKIYASGFRNPYDIIITGHRRMYTVDNGPNTTFGGYPENEGTPAVTNNYVQGEPGSILPTATEDTAYALDGFEFIGNIDSYIPGTFYGGHPNPIRANPQGAGLYTHDGKKGVWRNGTDTAYPLPRDWPPVVTPNAAEGDYLMAGTKDKSLVAFWTSTNGIAEYTASNFNSRLKGALLTTNFDNGIYKIKLTEDGTGIKTKVTGANYIDEKPFARNVGVYPLDITTQGDTDIFPGTIWVAGYASSNITILEPEDAVDCEGASTGKGCWRFIKPDIEDEMAREENAYVAVGTNFYLLGGRGIQPVMMFNSLNNSWTEKAKPPIELHHFQAVTKDSLIYVLCSFTGEYPHEKPVPNIYVYNTGTDKWIAGPPVPEGRRRGASGAFVRNNKIYVVAGMVDGHWSGGVTWFDEYDPETNSWKILPDAPRARDHFQAALVNNKLYLAGGRKSSAATEQVFELTIPEVDVYDFATGIWETLPEQSNIPTPRGGTATAVLNSYLIVIGGENAEPKALKHTEALDVSNNKWTRWTDLQQGRHGTQAINYKNAIYITSGAGNQGGTNLLNSQEFFYLPPPY